MKAIKLFAPVIVGVFMLSGLAVAGFPNGQSNTPLIKQETHGYLFSGAANNTQQPRAYYGTEINGGAALNKSNLSPSEYRNYVHQQTAPNNFYGGGEISNIPLEKQQPAIGAETGRARQGYEAQSRPYYGTQPRNHNNYVPHANNLSQDQYRDYVRRQTAPNRYYGGGQISNIPLAVQNANRD